MRRSIQLDPSESKCLFVGLSVRQRHEDRDINRRHALFSVFTNYTKPVAHALGEGSLTVSPYNYRLFYPPTETRLTSL